MLKLTIPGIESYDENRGEFVTVDDTVIELEHSLVSLSKWEEEFEKPFLDKTQRTSEEILAYIMCMVLTPDVPPEVFGRLTQKNIDDVMQYIQAPRTGTTVHTRDDPKKRPETLTSELMYYYMFSLQIDKECETWHLNRLFTLVRVFSAKNADDKPKKSTVDDLARRRALNEQRKAKLNSRG